MRDEYYMVIALVLFALVMGFLLARSFYTDPVLGWGCVEEVKSNNNK